MVQTTDHQPEYQKTRQAWRDIWATTNFERELATLDYPRAQALLKLYLPYLPHDAPILEAGCGPAHIVHYLQGRGYQALGLDYAPEALLPTRLEHPELILHLGDVHHLPYPTNTFGGYLSFGVVEHFEQGPEAALKEAFRVLHPGGVLVLTVPHPNFVEGLRAFADRLFPARVKNRPPRAEYYETTYDHHALKGFVTKVGFEPLLTAPYSHSYTFYGLAPFFRAKGYYQTSALAELAGAVGRRLLPWQTAFECLIVARKP
ncbi:MAG: class I SAM-dependent methyltransferase [Anaerolinea sp.]|nr:class I SAM-dependent methyltransferase [Anaerolinea sp.]MCC6974272.1 class I SAM-dependent methyltransferase [Anaerolineae bacterium]CAG1006813.1 putative S-adenosylmethionine-dependent methyltransferase/MSMEI_2290 [Anaerolineae bacterium]